MNVCVCVCCVLVCMPSTKNYTHYMKKKITKSKRITRQNRIVIQLQHCSKCLVNGKNKTSEQHREKKRREKNHKEKRVI